MQRDSASLLMPVICSQQRDRHLLFAGKRKLSEDYSRAKGPLMVDELDDSTASGIWSRMLAGNRRFAEGKATNAGRDVQARELLVNEQHPNAIVLSCSDSRVAPEIIFDSPLGDLFTIRTAGGMVDDAVLRSIEFALDEFQPKLLVVLGHQHCSAVAAARHDVNELVTTTVEATGRDPHDVLDTLDTELEASSDPLLRFVGTAVWQAQMAELENDEDYEQVSVAHTIEYLVTNSSVIRDALDSLMIVGARYRLDSGLVEVLSF